MCVLTYNIDAYFFLFFLHNLVTVRVFTYYISDYLIF
jgi:hypothetical protein